MFGKSFKLVFGVGAGVVATLSLAAVVIWGGVLVFQQFQKPGTDTASRLSAFEVVCKAPDRVAVWKRDPPSIIVDSIPAAAKREELDWFSALRLEFEHLDAFRAVCKAQGLG
jgi:hypothetical protein